MTKGRSYRIIQIEYIEEQKARGKEMKIHTILVAGRMHKELQEIINQKKLTQTFRFMEEQDVTMEDLNWADALLSFGPTNCFEDHSFKWIHSLGAGVDRFLESGNWKRA